MSTGDVIGGFRRTLLPPCVGRLLQPYSSGPLRRGPAVFEPGQGGEQAPSRWEVHMDVSWNKKLKRVEISDGRPTKSGSVHYEFSRNSLSSVTLDSIHQTLQDSTKISKDTHGHAVDFCVISTPHDPDAYPSEDDPRQYEFFLLTRNRELAFCLSVRNACVRTREEVEERSALYLRRLSVRINDVKYCKNAGDAPPELEIEILPPLDWTVSQCADVSEGLRVLLRRREATPKTAIGAYTLLLAGKPEMLLGQLESDWLEAKRKNYGISAQSQKYEFACDIASLANSPSGGILVIGIGTERDHAGRDVLS